MKSLSLNDNISLTPVIVLNVSCGIKVLYSFQRIMSKVAQVLQYRPLRLTAYESGLVNWFVKTLHKLERKQMVLSRNLFFPFIFSRQFDNEEKFK